jgi:hypothetical protein
VPFLASTGDTAASRAVSGSGEVVKPSTSRGGRREGLDSRIIRRLTYVNALHIGIRRLFSSKTVKIYTCKHIDIRKL